jgi:Protein of unknown function (DUF3237)
MQDFNDLCHQFALREPTTQLAWQAVVECGSRIDLGMGPRGHRYLIPIEGGYFEHGLLRGKVLAGGADRQLWRPDGVRELDALYEMQTHDGYILTIHNKVLIDEPDNPQKRYALSHVSVTAQQGPYEFLNRRVYVGTLHGLKPERRAVLIRIWQLMS